MKRLYYMAIIDKGRRDYGAHFPDLPGCVGAGRTVADAIADAEKALVLHLRGMVEDGDPVPEPSPPEAIGMDKDIAELTRVMIPADLPGRAVRINISMDETLLERIDRAAGEQGLTRSGFLAAAARKLIDA
ncbi:MAG TPA: CopG family transcriptional regulator [Alphaproteobacteria bacterium]|nr:CopG family transcriptional regulator [Alphaproteobacteria bacterium]